MELAIFEKAVVAYFTMEIRENPKLYSIDMIMIPTKNPKVYIDNKVEKMRTRLAKVIIKEFLSRQKGHGKILLYKIIDMHLKQYMKEYTNKVLYDHYNSWYTIVELQEIKEGLR